jgi:SAM-dependent methyltransferase
MKAKELKSLVQDKYGHIVQQSLTHNQTSCCGSTNCCEETDYTIFSDDYTNLAGYNPDADLGLGCGLPTEFAGIQKGNHVLDLGSGAGNDCFVARTLVGDEGKVTGLDFTEAMIQKASANLAKTVFKNIEFILGDIENIPLKDNSIDVVISNCVLNLVPDKQKAFAEIYRVLKTKGHFCISDIVLNGNLPKKLKEAAEMYAGCVSGALQNDKYLEIIKQQGFNHIEIKRKKEVKIPNSILLNYINLEEIRAFKRAKTGIYSITITAYK